MKKGKTMLAAALMFAVAASLTVHAQAGAAPMAQKSTPTPAPTRTPSAAQVTATAKAEVAQATKEAKAAIAVATAEARAEIIAAFAEYLPITRPGLAGYAEDHVGEKVMFKGTIFNIVKGDDRTMQVNYASSSDAIYVETIDPIEGVYNGTTLTLYGIVEGTKCFKNTYDNDVCQPHISNAQYFTRPDRDLQAAQATAQVEAKNRARELNAARAMAAAEAKATVAAISAQYKSLAWRELVNYADRHAGEKIRVTGRVFNIVPGSNTQLQMFVAGTSEAIFVEMEGPFSGLYKDSKITVYGEIHSDGFHCFNNSMGAEVCQPALINAFYSA